MTSARPSTTPSTGGTAEGPAQRPFAQLGRLGHTSWSRHLAALTTIVVFWTVGGGAAAVLVLSLTKDPSPGSPSAYLALMASFVPLLAGIAVAVRFVHRRPLLTLITPLQRVDSRRLLVAFALYLALATGVRLGAALLHPDDLRLTFHPLHWLTLLPVVVILTAIQSSAEELLFRGYVLQTLGLLTRRPSLLVGASALLFAALHLGNVEAAGNLPLMAAFYLANGLFFSFITLRDNRLELALGAHAAGNLTVLVINTETTSLAVRPVWQVSGIDPVGNLVAFLLVAAVFSWLMLAPRGTRTRRRAAGASG